MRAILWSGLFAAGAGWLYWIGANAEPSCISDWRLCDDSTDFFNVESHDLRMGRLACASRVEESAKYGDVEWFERLSHSRIDGLPMTRMKVLIFGSRDARFQSPDGTIEKVRVICLYNLHEGRISELKIEPL